MTPRVMFAGLIVVASCATHAAETRKVTLDVQGMTCAACPITVRQVLKKQPGVTDVKVDYKSHSAEITFDPSLANLEQFAKVTSEAGFPATVLK